MLGCMFEWVKYYMKNLQRLDMPHNLLRNTTSVNYLCIE